MKRFLWVAIFVLGPNGFAQALAQDMSIETIAVARTDISGAVAVTRTMMSGDVILTTASNNIQHFDPNGSDRNIDLPDGAANQAVTIAHVGSANTLTVRQSVSDGGATVTTLVTNGRATVVHDGTAWVVY